MRSEARIHTSVWRNPDFTALPSSAQAAYWMVLSQPDMSMAGTVALMSQRWDAFRADRGVEVDLKTLEEAEFLVVDEVTREVWVRSFPKNDGVLRSVKTRTSMWAAWRGVFSPTIRQKFVCQVGDGHVAEAIDKGWIARSEVEEARAYTPSDTPSPVVPDTPSDRESPRARAASTSTSTSSSTSLLAAIKPPRPQDELFETLIDSCGLNIGELTDSARGAANKAAKELRKVGASPEGVRARAETYRHRWPEMELTPSSLAKHYAQLGSSKPPKGRGPKGPTRPPDGEVNYRQGWDQETT